MGIKRFMAGIVNSKCYQTVVHTPALIYNNHHYRLSSRGSQSQFRISVLKKMKAVLDKICHPPWSKGNLLLFRILVWLKKVQMSHPDNRFRQSRYNCLFPFYRTEKIKLKQQLPFS